MAILRGGFAGVVRSGMVLAAALAAAQPGLAGAGDSKRGPVPTPVTDITDPQTLVSPDNPDAAPVPLADLSAIRTGRDAAWTPDGKSIIFSTNPTGRFNLWKLTEGEMMPVQLTQSDDPQGAIAVSPDGRYAYFTADKGGREVYDLYRVPVSGGAVENLTASDDLSEDYPILSADGRTALLTLRRADGSVLDVGLIDLASRKLRNLTSEQDQTLQWRPVAFTPDGKSVIAVRNTADYAASMGFVIDLATGQQHQIIPSKPTDFVEPAAISPDGTLVAFTTTMGTGRHRAGLFNLTTGEVRLLPQTAWIQYAVTFTPDGRRLVVQDNADGRLSLSLIEIDTFKARPINIPPGSVALDGRQQGSFNPRTGQMLVNRDAGDSPLDYWLVDPTGAAPARQITRLSIASLSNRRLPANTIVHYRSFDGTPISALVTMPFNLKRDGSAPLIVLPHGGPPSQSQDFFSRQITALASRGYIVMQPNYRGSTGYGDPFMNANDRDFGGGDIKDIVAGVDFMKRSGFVDPKRVGIMGGSYGGFLTLTALGKYPQVFSVGVDLYGVINWHTMYANKEGGLHEYLKAKLGDPAQNKALYDAMSPMTFAHNIRAPLLILQGENDARVPRDQAEQTASLIRSHGGTVEAVFYPNEGHGFTKKENAADSLRRAIEWFDKYLK